MCIRDSPHPFAVHPLHIHGGDVHFLAIAQQRAEIILGLAVFLNIRIFYHAVHPFNQLHQALVLLLLFVLFQCIYGFIKKCHISSHSAVSTAWFAFVLVACLHPIIERKSRKGFTAQVFLFPAAA